MIWTTHKSILVLLFIALSVGKLVQVPYISNDQVITIRLEQLTELKSPFAPFGKLNNIYKKEVFQIIDGKENPFSPCYELPPQAKFYGHSTRPISNLVPKFGIIHQFEQIKFPRSLIDIAIFGSKLYYMLQNGKLKIDEISLNYKRINAFKQHQSAELKVAQGNIVIMPQASNGTTKGFGLFINQKQAMLIDLQSDTMVQLNNYQQMETFESAIYLENNLLAVAYGVAGMKIFSIDFANLSLKMEGQINKNNSGLASINIKDLAYDAARKILFILDHNSGVLSLQLMISGSSISSKLTSSSFKGSLCNLIYYDSYRQQLYLNCKQLRRYRINNWPVKDEKVLPRQDISIRQIIAIPNLVALVGRNVFQIILADRKAAIYEDRFLDKLILTEHFFISANQYEMMIGEYTINSPTIECAVVDRQKLGNHRLLFKVTAQCNQAYINTVSFQPGQLAPDDKCIYQAYQNVQIWEPAHINTTPFMVIAIGVAILAFGILVWLGLSELNLRKLRNYVDHYRQLQEEGKPGTEGDTGKKTSMVQIDMPKQSAQEKDKHVQLQQEIDQPNNDLHDIE